MKKLTTLTVAALALATLSTTAFAQVPVAGDGTDMVLAFRVDDAAGTGANTDLEVDLGSFSQFTTTSVGSFTGPTGLEAADLISTYGANFATRGDLVFDVAGVTSANDGSKTAYVTQSGTPQVSTSSFAASSLNILQEESTLGSSGTPTLDSTEAGTIGTVAAPAVGIAGSYSQEEAQAVGGYNFFTTTTILGGNIADTETVVNGALTTLNLYSYVPGSGRNGTAPTLLGTFDLTAAGTLTYTGAAVVPITPEPSTYALMALGLGALAFGLRRRAMKA